MTKSEALALQKRCEGYFDGIAGYHGVELSMSLTGKLKLSFDGNYVTFNDSGVIDYMSFVGFWCDLGKIMSFLPKACDRCAEDLQRLKWSYEHIGELENG